MNNPFQGLGEQLQCRPGDALVSEPNARVHLIGRKQRRPRAQSAPRTSRFHAIPNPWRLTGAQCAVMNRLVDGCTNKEITEQLHMAEKTVELHLHNIRKAMGMHRTVVAALAWDRFIRLTTTHPAETAQPLAGNGAPG